MPVPSHLAVSCWRMSLQIQRGLVLALMASTGVRIPCSHKAPPKCEDMESFLYELIKQLSSYLMFAPLSLFVIRLLLNF
jgi:hypothetical protein